MTLTAFAEYHFKTSFREWQRNHAVSASISQSIDMSAGITALPVATSFINVATIDDLPALNPLAAPLAAMAALILVVAAQSWINQLIGGEQGLGAFLSDGTGYNKSGFKPRKRGFVSNEDRPLGGPDPLPWLKLPDLDFVEVAGQQTRKNEISKPDDVISQAFESQAKVLAKLEPLMAEMKMEVERGNLKKAKLIENEIEQIAQENDYDFS
ncbi:hypothetical protein ACHAXS_013460 [Conticribra weissflogii]